jgi:5-methylcytosine-specific restriction enzyme A
MFVDHKTELRDGGAPLDRRNVWLLCGSCHSLKTARERARRTAERPSGAGGHID